jgi:hypothetical protein
MRLEAGFKVYKTCCYLLSFGKLAKILERKKYLSKNFSKIYSE